MVQCRQDFDLFRVQFRQDSGLFRVDFRQDFGLFWVQFDSFLVYSGLCYRQHSVFQGSV